MAEIFKEENILENVVIKEEIQEEIPPSSSVEDTGPLEDTCTVEDTGPLEDTCTVEDTGPLEDTCTVYIKEESEPSDYIKKEIIPSVYIKEKIPPSVYIKEEDVKVEITETKGKTLI